MFKKHNCYDWHMFLESEIFFFERQFYWISSPWTLLLFEFLFINIRSLTAKFVLDVIFWTSLIFRIFWYTLPFSYPKTLKLNEAIIGIVPFEALLTRVSFLLKRWDTGFFNFFQLDSLIMVISEAKSIWSLKFMLICLCCWQLIWPIFYW